MIELPEDDILKKAINAGDDKRVDIIIEIFGLNFIDLWYNGCVPLHYALKIKQLKCAEIILKAGAFIHHNIEDQSEPLLHLAVNVGSTEFLKHLLYRKPNINALNGDGETALHIAVKNKSIEIVNMLLSAGADINVECKKTKMRPFHMATMTGKKRLITWFLNRGIDINLRSSSNGNTALHYLCNVHQNTCYTVSIVEYLLQRGANVNVENFNGVTPLFAAVKGKYFFYDVVEILLRYKIDFDVQGNRSAFLLSLDKLHVDDLCNFENPPISEMMLLSGLTLRKADTFNLAMLRKIITNNHALALERLLQLGLSTETVVTFVSDGEIHRQPLLHASVQLRHHWLVRILLHYGAKVNRKDERGRTALFYTLDLNLMKELINNGADVNAKLETGTSVLHNIAKFGHEDMISLLLSSKANFNFRTKTGMTPLHYAAIGGNFRAINLIVKSGADVSAKMDKNLTSLHLSLMYGHKRSALTLLQYDADIDVCDDFGRTPLHIAISRGMSASVRHLLARGADIHIEDTEGRTPYLVAMDYEQQLANYYTPINEELHRHFYPEVLYDTCSTDEALGYSDREKWLGTNPDRVINISNKDNLVEVVRKYSEFTEKMKRIFNMDEEDLERLIKSEGTGGNDLEMAKEVKIMRDTEIYNGVTFYDVLTKNCTVVAKILGDKKVVNKLLECRKYTYYRFFLQKKVSTAEGYYFKSLAMNHMFLIFKKKLPDEICLKIINFFNKNDMKNFVIATRNI